ncbi:MAG: hypothetical protein IPN29_19945 [Saprospiraceae bacterium]|nr:hypothetical protein [Saprospiraceae bacterium]
MNKKKPNDDIEWSIVGETLGVAIEDIGQKARLTSGNEYGKVKIRAKLSNDEACKVEEYLDVNMGVKEVEAFDLTHGRMAKTGDTLYVVGHADVEIRAIPNEGPKPQDLPDWKDDNHIFSATPPDFEWSYVSLENPLAPIPLPFAYPIPYSGGFVASYCTGIAPNYEPCVHVVKQQELTINQPSLGSLGAGVKNIVKYFTDTLFSYQNLPWPSTSCPPSARQKIAIDTSFGFVIKYTNVEKNNSNELEYKKEGVLEVGLTLVGKAYDPRIPECVPIPFGGYIGGGLFIGGSVGTGINLTLTSDPSQEQGNEISASINGKIELCLFAGGDFVVQGGAYGMSASISGKLCGAAGAKYVLGDDKITGKISIDPATVAVKIKIMDPTNLTNIFIPEELNFEYKVINSYESPDIVLLSKTYF